MIVQKHDELEEKSNLCLILNLSFPFYSEGNKDINSYSSWNESYKNQRKFNKQRSENNRREKLLRSSKKQNSNSQFSAAENSNSEEEIKENMGFKKETLSQSIKPNIKINWKGKKRVPYEPFFGYTQMSPIDAKIKEIATIRLIFTFKNFHLFFIFG